MKPTFKEWCKAIRYICFYDIELFIYKRRCNRVLRLAKIGYINKIQATEIIKRLGKRFKSKGDFLDEYDNEGKKKTSSN